MALTIAPVRTRPQLADFITLPCRLYQDMPGYVAPLDYERRMHLDPRKSPFFSHGCARYWIAHRDHRPVGRISAQIDFLADGPGSREIGLFGCLDAIDDGEVVATLLSTAEDWLRERGKRLVRGPFLLSINGETGLLVDGQTEPPMSMMPWHPRYLKGRLWESGYRLAKSLYSYVLDLQSIDVAHHIRLLGLDRNRPEFVLRGLRLGELDSEARIATRLFNDAWRHNWGFTPLTDVEVQTAMRRSRPFLFPYCATFVEYRGEPVSIYLVTPNLFEITADLGNAPSILGWIRFAVRVLRKRYRSCRILLFGVSSRYRNSVAGAAIAATVIGNNLLAAQSLETRLFEAGWILEDNQPTIDILERFNFRRARSYGVYEKSIAD